MTLDQQLEQIISNIPSISISRNYWLVRTQSGLYYDDFIKNKYIAIEPANVTVPILQNLERKAAGNLDQLSFFLKDHIKKSYKDVPIDANVNRNITLKANQIIKFLHEIKAGDIVIIPSENSDYISFGEVVENHLALFSEQELNKIECPFQLRKKIKWLKTIPRHKLDINLYMLFVTHQAISEINKYANVIERSLNSFYVLYENAHIIFNVETQNHISAKDLFGFGSLLLETLDEYAEYAQIDVNSSHFDLEINLNSPGKLDLKSKIKKSTYVLGVLVLLCGGGYQDKSGHSMKTDGVPGLIKSISEFLNQRQDREMKEKAFNKYIDSLHIKNPEEFNKLLKQFSDNKDLPK